MNTNGKVIGRSTVSPLDPSDYDVNKCKKHMPDLDTTTKSSIGDYRNAVNVKNTDVPDFDDEDTKDQLSYNFDLKESNIDDSKEVAGSDKNRPDMDDAPNSDVESTAFDKLGASSISGRFLSDTATSLESSILLYLRSKL